MEGRGLAKGNPRQHTAPRAQDRVGALSALERVRQVAERDKQVRFTTLLHHVYNVDHLRAAYFALKRDAAPGIDGETWQLYGEALEENLRDLSGRLARGAYRAKPVKRAYIPKADGRPRPLGIPTVTANRGTVQRTFRFLVRDTPLPPAGGPAAADPVHAASSGRTPVCL
jgi:RNA-directed DNA polymerase